MNKTLLICSSSLILLSSCGNPFKKNDYSRPIPTSHVYSAPVYVFKAGTSNVMLGRGMNSFQGRAGAEGRSECITKSDVQTLGNLNGANTIFQISSIKSSEDFYEKIGKDMSLSATYGSNRASGSRNSLAEMKIKSEKSYAFIFGSKQFQPQNITEFNISPEVVAFYEANPDKFFDNCGDEFISSVTPGAQIIGLLECDSSSSEKKKAIEAKISAKAGFKGVAAEGDLKSSLQEIVNEAEGKCSINVESMGGEGAISTQFESFAQSVVDYISRAQVSNAVPVAFSSMPYQRIQNLDFHSKVMTKVALEFERQNLFLYMKKSVLKILIKRSDSAETLLSMHRLDAARIAELEKQNKKTTADINNILSQIRKCEKNPTIFSNCQEESDGEIW